MKKNKVIVSILVLIVVLVFGFLGIWWGTKQSKPQTIANGIVLNKLNDYEYESVLIKNYNEYEELLKKYNVSGVEFFTEDDFEKRDYIVDFINYNDELIINNIDIEIVDNGIILNYQVNMEVESDEKLLMYFIPLDKNLINNLNIVDRSFEK